MIYNMKMSLTLYVGICLLIIFTGGLYATSFSESFFTLLTLGLFYLVGRLSYDQESKIKNLLSLVLPSIIGVVFSIAACLVYQHYVVNLYHYTKVPMLYKIVWNLSYYFNAPIVPISELAGNASASFELPYGLIYMFFVPTLMMWLGLERKSKKKKNNGGPV
jgi:hypothetical protein